MKTEILLDKLVGDGELTSYSTEVIEFEPGSGSRETVQLKLVFPSGKVLTIDSFCSGSAENTILIIS